MTYFEECVIDFDDPSSNKISTLKKEAANQGIEIPKNARKIDIINLIKEKRNSSLNSTAARNDQEYECESVIISERLLYDNKGRKSFSSHKEYPPKRKETAKHRKSESQKNTIYQKKGSSRQQSPYQPIGNKKFFLSANEFYILIFMLVIFISALFLPLVSPLFFISAIVLLIIHIKNKRNVKYNNK